MNLQKNKGLGLMLFLLSMIFAIVIAGCSGENESNNNNAVGADPDTDEVEENEEIPPEPVTIIAGVNFDEDRFIEDFKEPLEEKYEHITFEYMHVPFACHEEFQEVIVADNIPDVFYITDQTLHFQCMRDWDLEQPLDELIEDHDFDLTVFDNGVIEDYRNATPHGGLVALPVQSTFFALTYNKEIFDQFGVDYPADGMYWDEVLELGREMTREVDGIDYQGLHMNQWLMENPTQGPLSQFSSTAIDPETHEVDIVNSEEYRKTYDVLKDMATIPGNEPNEGRFYRSDQFWEGNVAMHLGWHNLGRLDQEEGQLVEFDQVSFPVWEGYEGIGPAANHNGWMISKHSEIKDEAFEAIAFLTSEEARIDRIKAGDPPALSNPELRELWAVDKVASVDRDINVEAVFLNTPATAPERSPYELDAPVMVVELVHEYGNRDINDFLRDLQTVTEEHVRTRMASD